MSSTSSLAATASLVGDPARANMLAALLDGRALTATELAGTAGRRRAPAVVGPRDPALRRARTCYDHLAGALAVAIADRMVASGHVEFSPDGGALTDDGQKFLTGLGLDLGAARARGGRVFCRPCLDWSERRPHIAGAVGAALCRTCFARHWVRRIDATRAVAVTPAGQIALGRAFGLRAEAA